MTNELDPATLAFTDAVLTALREADGAPATAPWISGKVTGDSVRNLDATHVALNYLHGKGVVVQFGVDQDEPGWLLMNRADTKLNREFDSIRVSWDLSPYVRDES